MGNAASFADWVVVDEGEAVGLVEPIARALVQLLQSIVLDLLLLEDLLLGDELGTLLVDTVLAVELELLLSVGDDGLIDVEVLLGVLGGRDGV